MMTLPSSSLSKLGSESKSLSSNEASKRSESDGLKSGQLQTIQAVQKVSQDSQANTNYQTPLPGTYYLKTNEARGKHMVRYVYANLTDPNDESLPFHIREGYKEIQKDRLRGYQQALNFRGASPARQHGTRNYYSAGNKLSRPASASYEIRTLNVPNDGGPRSGNYVAEALKEVSSAISNKKAVMKNIQTTRSSNTVLSPKRGIRSRSETSSPRPRRPFSIAADSTSDTDPIENQRSMESVPHRSPPRASVKRQVRRHQYLATKFKLAAKNSKHTQTFVAAAVSMEESSGSATTVISRHHSTTQTEIVDNNIARSESSQPDREKTSKPEEKDVGKERRLMKAEKPPIAQQNVAQSEATISTLTDKGEENVEWKRVKLRLRSTPRSPSPPMQESQHRVASADHFSLLPREKPSCLVGGRPASARSGLVSRVRTPTPPASERQFTSSATQIEEHQTTDTGVQVKLKKRRSPSKRQARRERRSPSDRSIGSKLSSQSGSKAKDDSGKTKKNKKKYKNKKSKSRDPSIRSLRSLRSFQSDVSTGIIKHVKIGKSSASPALSRSGRSASITALGETKKKKNKVKRKKSSNKIARFLKTLSKDKEAINVISKMAASAKKKRNK